MLEKRVDQKSFFKKQAPMFLGLIVGLTTFVFLRSFLSLTVYMDDVAYADEDAGYNQSLKMLQTHYSGKGIELDLQTGFTLVQH